jgi:predicted N-acetyltransferase YhbS
MITIRQERPNDRTAGRAVNLVAFGREAEAGRVDTIRSARPDVLPHGISIYRHL